MGGAVLGGEPSSPLSHKNRGASAAANPPRVGDVPEDGELEEVESDATTATPSDDGSSDDVSTPSFLSPRARQGRSRSRHSDRTASSSTEAESSHSLSSSYGSSTASSFSLRSGASASASKTGTTTKLQERMAEKRLAAAHQDAATDADNAAIEGTIAADVLKGTSRQEEALGRPEIEVTELGEAIDKGLDLTSEPHAETEASPLTASPQEETPPVAEGFEESSPHVVLQATVTEITPTHVTVTPADKSGKRRKPSLWPIDSVSIPYTHLVYALGSHLPDPLRTEARTKPEGVSWMREIQGRIKASHQIVLVGGGALGVEYATDIASLYPEKDVTLIHSRTQLLPNFDPRVHEVAYRRLKELGVRVVLGERLALTEGCPRGSSVRAQASQPAVCTPGDARGEGAQAHAEGMCVGDGRKRIKTTGGKEFECDLLLLCTGQQPNSALMAQLSPTSVDPATRLVRVHKTLQVAVPDPRDAAQQPFDARPPCGDCDCFLDKKAAGSDAALDPHEKDHLLEHAHIGVDGQDPHPHVTGRLRNVYAIGDVADAFGALNAGYQAWGMADIAAENIIREIDASNAAALSANSNPNSGAGSGSSPTQREKLEMAEFNPAANMLKLSLGMVGVSSLPFLSFSLLLLPSICTRSSLPRLSLLLPFTRTGPHGLPRRTDRRPFGPLSARTTGNRRKSRPGRFGCRGSLDVHGECVHGGSVSLSEGAVERGGEGRARGLRCCGWMMPDAG